MSSKSGSETTETTLPSWLLDPVQRNLQRAEDLQRLPFMPYRGAEIAAFNPNQVSAFENNIDAARAFGFKTPVDAMGGMPEASKYADGSFGYDSNSLYDQALLDSEAYDPAAFNKYQSFFDTSVGATNSLPTGTPSSGGGGGGGGNNAVDPNMVNIERMREERAREAQRQADAVATQNYLDDSQMSFSSPLKSPGHPSNQDYNYTPTAPVATPYSNPLLDQKGATPSVPYSNSRLDSKGYTPTIDERYEQLFGNPHMGK
jgi:hypothetical protein